MKDKMKWLMVMISAVFALHQFYLGVTTFAYDYVLGPLCWIAGSASAFLLFILLDVKVIAQPFGTLGFALGITQSLIASGFWPWPEDLIGYALIIGILVLSMFLSQLTIDLVVPTKKGNRSLSQMQLLKGGEIG